MEEQPRAGCAGLALARKAHRRDDAVDDPVLVCVRKDDRWALAAQLERNRDDALSGGLHDELADLGRAGEGQLAHSRMPRQRRAAFLAEPRQHVEYPFRQMLVTDLGHQQDTEWGVLSRLQDERIAGAESGGDFKRTEQDRRIPGDDRADDTQGLPPRIAQHLFAKGYRLALELAAEPAEIAKDVGCQPRLTPRLRAKRI